MIASIVRLRRPKFYYLLGVLAVSQLAGSLWVQSVAQSYRFTLQQSQVALGNIYGTRVHDVPQAPMTIDEHSGNLEVEGPVAENQWRSIFPPGGGYLYLGDDYRKMGISMWHQMHCLDAIRKAIIVGDTGGHSKHCLNYVLQALLCHSDPTLDDGLIPHLSYKVTHQCRNWNYLYDLATDNFHGFRGWLDVEEARKNNLTSVAQ